MPICSSPCCVVIVMLAVLWLWCPPGESVPPGAGRQRFAGQPWLMVGRFFADSLKPVVAWVVVSFQRKVADSLMHESCHALEAVIERVLPPKEVKVVTAPLAVVGLSLAGSSRMPQSGRVQKAVRARALGGSGLKSGRVPQALACQVRSLPRPQRCRAASQLQSVPGGVEGWQGGVQPRGPGPFPQGVVVQSGSFQVLREVVEAEGFQPVAEGSVLPGGCLFKALCQCAIHLDGAVAGSRHESLRG